MIKREITYQDYNDPPQTHTDTFWFHMTEPDIIEMDFDTAGGIAEHLKALIKSEDMGALLRFMKQFTLASIGERTEDGKGFRKTEAYRQSFADSAAFTKLYMDLVSNETLAAEFITGVLPKSLQEDIANSNSELKEKIATELGIKVPDSKEAKPTPDELKAQLEAGPQT